MFDVAVSFAIDMIHVMPVFFILYIIFDFVGSLLFGKK